MVGGTWNNPRVLQAFPDLHDLIIEAGNAASQISTSKADCQILRELHAAYMMHRKHDGSCDFQKVKHEVSKTKLTDPERVPYLYRYVLEHSGGQTMPFLIEAETMIKRMGLKMQCFHLEYYDNLCCVLKGTKQSSSVRWAVWVLIHAQPKLLSPSDVKRLSQKDNLQFIVLSDDTIRSLHAMAKINSMSTNEHFIDAMGTLYLDLAAIILSKRRQTKPNEFHPTTVEEAAYKCVHTLSEATGVKLTDSYDSHKPDDAKQKKSQKKDASDTTPEKINTKCKLRAISPITGSIAGADVVLLTQAGFAIGDVVFNTKDPDKVKYTITDVEDGMVSLASVATPVIEKEAELELFQEKVYKDAPNDVGITLVDGYELYKPSLNTDWKIQVVKANIIIELNSKQQWASFAGMQLTDTPKRSVTVLQPYAQGKLMLSPASLSIGCKPAGDNATDVKFPNISLGNLIINPPTTFFISSTTVKFQEASGRKKEKHGFINPFFFVGVTEDRDEANCELVKKGASDVVPVIQNTVKLEAGATLLLYRMSEKDRQKEDKQKKARKRPESRTRLGFFGTLSPPWDWGIVCTSLGNALTSNDSAKCRETASVAASINAGKPHSPCMIR